MAIFRDIKFNTGTCNDRLGAVGTVTGSTFSQKEKGLAIETGASKYIQYDKQLLPNGAFSVVVWAKVKPSHPFGTGIFNFISHGSTGDYGIMSNSDGSIGKFLIALSDVNVYRYFSYVPDKNWHCFIFTCTGNQASDINNAQMYVDTFIQGVNTTVSTGVQQARSNYVISGGSNAVATAGGFIAKIKVYDHVLTQDEVNKEQVEFNNAQPINKPKKGFVLNKPTDLSEYKGTGAGQGLVAAYNMQPVGNTLVDISGNGNNGAKIGQLVFNKKGIVGTRNTTGYYSSTPKTIDLNSNFSLNFRVKINTLTEYANIMTQTNTPTSFVWVYFETGGYLLLDQNSGGKCSVVAANYIGEESTFTINFVSATNTTTFYKNGIQLGVPLTTYNPVGARSGVITIGAYPNDTTWNCKNEIQDLRIYNRVLTLQEIKDYNNSFIQPTLLEDFSDAGADNQASVPREWAKTSGSFKVVENVIKQGELITNGDFSAGSTGWTLNGTTISGGAAHFVNSIPFTNSIKQNSIFTIGKLYKITFTISNYVSGSIIMFDQNSGATPAVNNNGTFTFNFIPTGTSFSITTTGTNGTFDIDNVSVTEIQPLQTITNGTKYLEAITAGVVATPSNTAYGSWEFDWYKGGNNNTSFQFIDQKIENFSGNSYWSLFTSATNNIGILYSNAFYIMQSSASYVNINTWYRIKITRTTTGLFTVLIKGGSFVPTAGYDGWTLVSVAGGLGTNPVTDNTYTTSNYFVMSLGAGDRVTNIKITNGLSSVSIPPTWLYGDNVLSQFWGDNLGLELWGDNL